MSVEIFEGIVPGEITWGNLLKRLSFVIKSRTIGVRKALNVAIPVGLLSAGGLGIVGVAIALLSENPKAMQSDETSEQMAKRFEEEIKRFKLTPEEEDDVKKKLNEVLPTEEDINKATDEPITCPVIVEWYNQPAVWVISLSSLAIIIGIIYFIIKKRKK